MIFGWKKAVRREKSRAVWTESLGKLIALPGEASEGTILFQGVTLSPSIRNLSIRIEPASWLLLFGEDDFGKALFCDLCFGYVYPEAGKLSALKPTDVSFLGRSNTTYGATLVDHLSCGVRDNTRELMEFVVDHAMTERFARHLSSRSHLEFREGKSAQEMELDECDFLEIAEANVLLQKRRAVIIDTTSDFYQIALEQGFRHSEVFLNSGKTILWIVNGKEKIPESAAPWNLSQYKHVKKNSLIFQSGSLEGYIN